jgi:hypothetical protein
MEWFAATVRGGLNTSHGLSLCSDGNLSTAFAKSVAFRQFSALNPVNLADEIGRWRHLSRRLDTTRGRAWLL